MKSTAVALGLIGWLLHVQPGCCFYNPRTGRWLSRDPLPEKGASILARASPSAKTSPAKVLARRQGQFASGREPGHPDYAFCANAAVNATDLLGLESMTEAEAAGYCWNPCAQYRKARLEENPGELFGGGVVCCGGKHYACTWSADEIVDPVARSLIQRCQEEHERDHFDDVDCPPCDWEPRRPGYRDPSQQKAQECSAHSRQLYCLQNSLSQCGDPGCESAMWEWIQRITHYVGVWCGHGY